MLTAVFIGRKNRMDHLLIDKDKGSLHQENSANPGIAQTIMQQKQDSWRCSWKIMICSVNFPCMQGSF